MYCNLNDMPDTSTLIEVSAFSGLAGAIITQGLTGLFAYYNDKRKAKTELQAQFRNKKIEVAETYFYITGETMAILKRNISFWKNRNDSRSTSSIKFLSDEVKKLDERLEKLNTENWKHNLVSLYFDVLLSYNEIIEANSKSHLLYLNILDLAEQINNANGDLKEELYGQYNINIFNLCCQYEEIYSLLKQDMARVKDELSTSIYKVLKNSPEGLRLHFSTTGLSVSST